MQPKDLNNLQLIIEKLKVFEKFHQQAREVKNMYYSRYNGLHEIYANTNLPLPPMPTEANIRQMRRTNFKLNTETTSLVLERFSAAVYTFDLSDKSTLANIMTEKDPRVYIMRVLEYLRLIQTAVSIPLKQEQVLLYKDAPATLNYLSTKDVLACYSKIIQGHSWVEMGNWTNTLLFRKGEVKSHLQPELLRISRAPPCL